MIFVTVGHQMPFDRLVRTVDAWAAAGVRGDVCAQIGRTGYVPQHMEWVATMDPQAFRDRLQAADVVVGHAGMGTILSALELRKPILVLPRRAALGETRNDHQVATAARFRDRAGIYVAMDEAELRAMLDGLEAMRPGDGIPSTASPELIEALATFIGGA